MAKGEIMEEARLTAASPLGNEVQDKMSGLGIFIYQETFSS